MRREPSLRVGQQSNHILNRGNISVFVVWCFVLLVVMVLFNACASTKVVAPLPWQQKQIVIDGAATDWETPLSHRSKDAKIQYGFSNDGKNLYFCLMASDDQTQMKILMNGLELALDTTGGKKKHISIKFPLAQEKSFSDRGNALEGLPDIPKLRNKLLSDANEIEVKGFSTIGNGRLPLQNSAGIDVRIGWDSYNIMVYEAKIPLAIFSFKNSNNVLGVTINIKGLPQPQMPSGISGMPSGGRPPGGGMPGGGMPPNGMPRMDMSLFESLSAYLKVNLASK
jgi:hypothetical protein